MDQFVTFTILGIVLAAIYAIAASGLVVTYTTSGIFNFAHGAIGMIGAYAYFTLRTTWGLPTLLALLLVLAVFAPLLGFAIERLIMRGLDRANEVTRVVVSIALLFTLIELAPIIWNPRKPYFVKPFFGDSAGIGTDQPGTIMMFGTGVSYHQILVVVLAVGVAFGLRFILYGTRTGVAMRAVVDNRKLVELNGGRPSRSSALSWALGSSLAALAGVLIAERVNFDPISLTFLVVNAYAAAVVGRLTSLTRTFMGALVLGLLQAYAQGYLSTNPQWLTERNIDVVTGSRLALPVIMLFVVLLLIPHARLRTQGVVRIRDHVPKPSYRLALLGAVVLSGGVLVVSGFLGGEDTLIWSRGLAIGIVMLSLVPLTGYGGQISLAQMSFAGLGAYAVATWGIGGNPIGLVLAVVVAGGAGVLVALPALRLSGIYLALATLAFAFFIEKVVFTQKALFPTTSKAVDRLPGLESDRAYMVFLAVMFALVGLGVVWLRRSRFGRRLQAMKDSPAACATLGLNLTATKLQLFILSSAIAGLGGALLAGAGRSASTDQFAALQNLPVLLMAVAGGLSTVSGVFAGGMLLASFSLGTRMVPSFQIAGVDSKVLFADLFALAPGLLGISIGRNPVGIVPMVTSRARAFWESRTGPDVGEEGTLRKRRWLPVDPVFEAESLGTDRPYTPADIELIDSVLALDEEEVAAGVVA